MEPVASAVLAYRPQPGRYDEAIDVDGQTRPMWRPLLDTLGGDVGVLVERQRQADRLLESEGAGHLVHDLSIEAGTPDAVADDRPWRLDPLPLVLDGSEFERLARDVVQRMGFLEALLADAYGPRRTVSERILPGPLLVGSRGYRFGALDPGHVPIRWLVSYSVDVVRLADGSWAVVRDHTDAPGGLGFTLLDRAVLTRLLPDSFRRYGVVALADHAARMRDALAAQAPAGRHSPRTAILTGGVGHPGYIEHSYLAGQLGFHLVAGADLVVRSGRVWLRALGGPEPVDVVLRGLGDRAIDPLEVGAAGSRGVPGLVHAARRDGVGLANAYGAGLAEDRTAWPRFDDAARLLIGEPLRLRHLDLDADPAALATAPVHRGHGVEAGVVVLRLHAVATAGGAAVLPGGAGRVLAPGDRPEHPTARLAKDVWVVGGATRAPAVVRRPAIPQVDLAGSITTRAADALYLMGREAERAEAAARFVRVATVQLDQDPGLVAIEGGDWGWGVVRLAHAAAQRSPGPREVGPPPVDLVAHEVSMLLGYVADRVDALSLEAVTVRQFLSVSSARVLGRLAGLRADLVSGEPLVDDLDSMLVELAALAGLANESMVRGPAWRFGDLGRRLERSLIVLGSVDAAFGVPVGALAQQPLAEVLLAAHDSLVAYRRRHRSDVELDAVVDLLLHDDTNPRGLAFQLDRLREHTIALGWIDGADLVDRASRGLLGGGPVRQLVLDARGPLLDLVDRIVDRWFADPVDPHAMGRW